MTTPTKSVDLEEMGRLAEAATPGEWRLGDGPHWCVWFADGRPLPATWFKEDAAFIAASRVFVPAAIAELKALRAEVVQLAAARESDRVSYALGVRFAEDKMKEANARADAAEAGAGALRAALAEVMDYYDKQIQCSASWYYDGEGTAPCDGCPCCRARAALGAKGGER